MGVTRITKLTDEQRSRFNEWSDRWIEIGLRTGPADRAKFEAAVRACYGFAGITWTGRVVWISSPLALAYAAPTAALAIELRNAGAVNNAVRDAVDEAVAEAVHGAVRGAVNNAVRDAVAEAVAGAVTGAVRGAVHNAVREAVTGGWNRYFGGQLWVGWVLVLGRRSDVVFSRRVRLGLARRSLGSRKGA